MFPTNSKFNKRHEEFGLNQWYIVELKAKEKLVTQNLKSELDKTNLFEITEYYYAKRINVMPKSSVHTNTVFNDPRFDEQWHYENTGQTSGTSGADISLTEAWSVETGSDDVVVAIIDGGIDYNHQDLTNAMWINVQEENGTTGVDDDDNGYIDDIYGYNFGDNTGSIAEHPHGTHVAGTVGAVNNNSIGVSGIAGGSDTNGGARLMSCQTFGSYNADGFDVAFVYAADNGAVIAQNSWGYTSSGNYEQSVLDAIDYFIANAGYDADGNPIGRMQGGLVVFSAGNDDQDAQWYPAYYEPVFAVASTNHNDQKSWYSNFGDWVDISAPGGETNVTEEGVLSTLPNNSYGFYQGTSMACPHVSGVAALVVSNNTNLTPDGVKQTLLLGSDYIDDINTSYAGKLGQGRLNAFNSLSVEVDSVLYPINDLSINYTSFNKVIIQWTAKNNFNSGKYVSGYDIRYSTSLIDDSNFDTAIRIAYTNSPLDSAEVELFEIENLEATTEYYFAIKPISILGNTSDISNVISVTTNNPPEINVSISEIVDTLYTGETSEHTFEISNTGESDLNFNIAINYQTFSKDQTEFEYNIRTYSNNIPEYNVDNSLEDIIFKPDFTKKVYIGKSDDNILVMEATSGANHYDDALNNLGLSRTLVTNWDALEAELVNGTDWELVIINSYSNFPSTSVLDEINNYLVSGELLIFADWGMYNYSSHALLQNMGIEFVSDFSTPLNILSVETSHQIFNNPNQFDNLLWTDNQANIDGQIVNILPAATQLAAFDGYSNSGAIVLNSSNNSIFNGFQAINFNGDDDSDGKLDIIELIENQISFLLDGAAFWLNTDISSGTIPAGSAQEIAVTLNASGKNAGTYNANLVIENNDPDTSNYSIPVTLEVNGAPEIVVENDTIILNEVFIDQEITDSIYIENIGTDTLEISLITWDETVFDCLLNDSIIAPGEKEQFVLTFISSSEGSFTDSIEIISNSFVDSVLYFEVFAEALLPPIMVTSPDTIVDTLYTGQEIEHLVNIGNL